MNSRFSRRVVLATAVAALGAGASAQPTAWPTRPVKILVGFPPGSTPDIAARLLGDALARAVGQPVVI